MAKYSSEHAYSQSFIDRFALIALVIIVCSIIDEYRRCVCYPWHTPIFYINCDLADRLYAEIVTKKNMLLNLIKN